MLPDDKLGNDGCHDVIMENLSGTPTWRSSHVSPAEVTLLRRQWPKAVFDTLRRRMSDVECLRRDAPKRTDKAFVTEDRVTAAFVIHEHAWPWMLT